jgi:hypothetical protein
MRIQTQEFDVEIDLKGIEVLGMSLPVPINYSGKPVSYSFQIELDHRIDIASQLVFIISNVEVTEGDAPVENQDKAGIIVSCFFEVKELVSKVTVKEDGIITIPIGLLQVLNSISISTTRGVMFSSFKGTHLHNAILPMLDPSHFKPRETK